MLKANFCETPSALLRRPMPLGFAALLSAFLIISGPAEAAAPDAEAKEIAVDYVASHLGSLGLIEDDVADVVVSDSYLSSHTGTRHVHLQQRIDGIEVVNATLNLAISRHGNVAHVGNRFRGHLADALAPAPLLLTASEAVERAALELDLGRVDDLRVLDLDVDRDDRRTLLNGAGISRQDITARLVYQPLADGRLRLAWDLVIDALDESHWWNLRIDAATGDLLDTRDWVDQEQYEVIALPFESPNHTPTPPPADGRTIEVNPYLDALHADNSPFGWHDTDGVAGAEFTITRGNNVHAYADKDGNNVPDAAPNQEPDGGATLDFSGGVVPIDFTMDPDAYVQAAIANLFYWSNITHDLTYQYGFDGASGNFQVTNYSGMGLGGDDVQGEAQNLGNCNANFGTPPDGQRPRMQMFKCNNTSPARDSDFDGGVIIHEYGHGISNRLTGGPSNVGCLGNTEQMGEGWGDYLGMMFTVEAGDMGTDARGMGTYFIGQPITGPGIRPAPYSTDFGVNGFTYSNISGVSVPHGVGFVYATMLWEMTWDLIGVYGLNLDVYGDHTTGGNNLATQLVMDGMKLQPCGPGFVDGRDAILAADNLLTGDGTPLSGANQCLIWGAFARRGLGFSADQGLPSSVTDGTEAFDLPPYCETLGALPSHQNICQGDVALYRIGVGSDFTPPVDLSATGEPAGTITTFDPNPVVLATPTTSDFTISDTGAAAAGSYTVTVTGDDGGPTIDTDVTLTVFDSVPATTTNVAPADGAIDEPIQPTFEWTAVADALSYDLDVADNPSFTNIVYSATGLTGTTHNTPVELDFLTTYYWRVRSVNSCGGGTDSTTFSFTTAQTPAACEPGITAQTIFEDDLESGVGSWTSSGTGDTWTFSGARVTSGVNAFYALDPETLSDQRLVSPAIVLPDAGSSLTLQFQNYQLFETPNTDGRCWDAGILEVTTDGGANWAQVPQSAMLTDPYDNIIWNDTPGNNPITNDYGATDAWCAEEDPYKQSVVDISAWANETVQFRWRLGSDSAAGNEGWYLDDIKVQQCPGSGIFADGFESGDTSVWSNTVP